jgi:hypothetical protein
VSGGAARPSPSGTVTAAVRQDPYEQEQHQPQEPGQDQDDAHDVHVQAVGGGGGDVEPQGPPAAISVTATPMLTIPRPPGRWAGLFTGAPSRADACCGRYCRGC